jgi:hypothetical protein
MELINSMTLYDAVNTNYKKTFTPSLCLPTCHDEVRIMVLDTRNGFHVNFFAHAFPIAILAVLLFIVHDQVLILVCVAVPSERLTS